MVSPSLSGHNYKKSKIVQNIKIFTTFAKERYFDMFKWYNDKTRPNFWGAFYAVSLWMVFGILCMSFLHNYSRPQLCSTNLIDGSIVKDIEQRKGIVDWSQLQVDSQNVLKLSSQIYSSNTFQFVDVSKLLYLLDLSSR